MDTLADLGVRMGNLKLLLKSCIQQHYEPFTAQRLCIDGSAKRQKASTRPAQAKQAKQAKNPRGLKPSAMRTLAVGLKVPNVIDSVLFFFFGCLLFLPPGVRF